MVRPLPHDRARPRRDFRRDGRQGQDRKTQRRREPEDGLEIRGDVDSDPDDLQGRRDGLAPGRRRAEAETAAVDYRSGLIRFEARNFFRGRPANSRPFALRGMSRVEEPSGPPSPRRKPARKAAALSAMEARSVDEIPRGAEWQYEPKWDGFRCLLSRRGHNIGLRSKSGEDLARYFPELVQAALELNATTFLLDGEIVVPHGKTFSFDDLLQRIHPAASRVTKLSRETPALFLAFDLLESAAEKKLAERPLRQRRPALEAFAKAQFRKRPAFRLSPATSDYAVARKWLALAGGGSDGVIAKRIDLPYQSGNREGMQKIKKFRSADCVIGGFRYATNKLNNSKV